MSQIRLNSFRAPGLNSFHFLKKMRLLCAAAALIFVRIASAQSCLPEHYDLLMPGGLASLDQYGAAICAHGDWLFVGAPGDDQAGSSAGAVYVFKLKDTMWTFSQKLLPTGGIAGGLFGSSIAADQNVVMIGAAINGEGSAAYAFTYEGTQWVQTQKILPFGPGDVRQFGWAVAIEGNLAVIGARYLMNDGVNLHGAAYTFQFDGSNWVGQQRLVSDAPSPLDLFGTAIAIANQQIIVGAANDDSAGNNAGAVFAFIFNGAEWVQQQKLIGAGAGDTFGTCVAADPVRLMIGAPQSDLSNATGAVYPYRFENEHWISDGGPIASMHALAGDHAGSSIALRGDRLLIGAPLRSVPDYHRTLQAMAGAAFVFRRSSGQWVEDREIHISQPASNSIIPFGPYVCWSYGIQPQNWPGNQNLFNTQYGKTVAISDAGLLASTPQNVRPYCWSYDGPDLTGSVNLFALDDLPPDCNGNGIQDACESTPDCNGNFVPDECDIASNNSGDCNVNSVPDECEEGTLYQLETGQGGLAWYINPESGDSDVIWLNQFRVRSGGQVVAYISLATSPYLPAGTPVTVILYSDPNQDGDPSDANLLATAQTTALAYSPDQDDQFANDSYRIVHVPITPTHVGNPGDFFFVGAYLSSPLIAHAGGLNWAAMVALAGGNLQRSWYAHAPYGQGDIHNLMNNASPVHLSSIGPFVLRAIAADCNGNGIWDACDIQSGTLPDVNGNGIPDGCEAPGCLFADISPSRGDGVVDVADLLSVINHWGMCTPCYAICPGDTNEDCAINVTDLLAVIGSWGPCPR